jgi:hypothetical protein
MDSMGPLLLLMVGLPAGRLLHPSRDPATRKNVDAIIDNKLYLEK